MGRKTVIRRQREKKLEEELPATEPQQPPGKFNAINLANVQEFSSRSSRLEAALEKLGDRLTEAIERDTNMVIKDEREAPVVVVSPTPIEVNPPVINMDQPLYFEPKLNIEPSAIDIKVPTQRVDIPTPKVTVKNETDITHLVVIGYILAVVQITLIGVGLIAVWP